MDSQRLIWVDLEMTGLDPDHDAILEIATIVTTAELEVIAEGPVIAIAQPEAKLAAMDDWNQKHHGSSGLLARVRSSKVDTAAAESATLAFLRAHTRAGTSPMCGNSICQDRRFIARWMPELLRHFHYRNLDVSTLKELAARWYPDCQFAKENAHTALSDIRESIAELRYYREHLFIPRECHDS